MKVAAEICPLCGGSGWKPAENSRVLRCECRLKHRAESLLSAARIPKRYEHCELSNFEFEGPHAHLMKSRMAACKFVEEYPIDNTGLLLIGSIGVGKTHLAVGIIKELVISKGIPSLFYDYRELLKQIQNSYNDSVKATELDGMGVGHCQLNSEHPLQQQSHDDHHDQLSGRCGARFQWHHRVRTSSSCRTQRDFGRPHR